MKRLATVAAAAATALALTTPAAAATPLEQRLNAQLPIPVTCVDTISRWDNTPAGPRVELWRPYCKGLNRSIQRHRHLDAATTQGWAIYTSILIDITAAQGGESDGLGAADYAVVPLVIRGVLWNVGIRGRYLNRLEAHVRLTVAESQLH